MAVTRAVSTVLGALLLTAVALVLAGTVGVFAVDLAPGASAPTPHRLTATANASSGRIAIVHASGPTLDVRSIEVRISIDGTPLRHQPPVPFLGSKGFRGAPVGPFNIASDPGWDVGERAALVVAGTNDPPVTAGAVVRVELDRDGIPLATTETRAR